MLRKRVLALLLGCCCCVFSQQTITATLVDNETNLPLIGAKLSLQNTTITTTTLQNGTFILSIDLRGRFILNIEYNGYDTLNIPLQLNGKPLDLGTLLMYKNIIEAQNLSLITITDDELNDDTYAADNIAGLLQSTKDVFLRTAAFDFSASFFRIRGLESSYSKILLNGVVMNKVFNGRAQWSNWGGLNDVLRNQEFTNGLAASNQTFGAVLGATSINTRASLQRPGGRVSYSSSNRSYQHRVMATYNTGLLKNGWAFSFSGSRRIGKEGFNEGTSYNAYSFFASAEKKLHKKHSINIMGLFAPNRRGKSSPLTQEVANLKGIAYNEYWGFLNNNKQNSRIKDVAEPIVMLSHYWQVFKNTNLQTNISYQFGHMGNSRLDFNAGANPSPTYYQYLPSFFERSNNLAAAYTARNIFEDDGQLNWTALFDANSTNASVNLNNAYVLYEDRIEDKQLTLNSILNSTLTKNSRFTAKLVYRRLNSSNFANILDLLGGNGYLDINRFGATEIKKQNNLLTPNRVVKTGDAFKYNYNLLSAFISGFTQLQFKYNKIEFYGAATVSNTQHQREGLYQNGRFENTSLGKSALLKFTNFGLKTGATYKITGRHLLDVNVGFSTLAPNLQNAFSNARENNAVVDNLISEQVLTADFSYFVRTPIITSRLTTYYTQITDATEISFYFADGVGGDNTAFVQEVMTGIKKQHIGLEFGLEAQVTPSLNLKVAAAVGQFFYANNPSLYLTSDVANVNGFDASFKSKTYTALLKNYRLATGPQNAYSFGIEYRDPDYWWFGATANFFSNTFIDVAPLIRSQNFFEDTDGLPFNDYDVKLANTLLQQERFKPYTVVNLVGGKSWLLNGRYISVFATVNNLLNTQYKSGGFEQGRNANYRQLRDDKALDNPVFGNKYWFGRGTTYFLNFNVSL